VLSFVAVRSRMQTTGVWPTCAHMAAGERPTSP
jgi:hypothetical protein